MFKLHIRTNRLSDGSETHDVVLCDLESADAPKSRAVMEFCAVTFDDAFNLMLALKDGVENHTNDEIEVK